MNIYMN